MVSDEPVRVYEVVEQVGKGSTGTVFKIKQIISQQPEPQPQQSEPQQPEPSTAPQQPEPEPSTAPEPEPQQPEPQQPPSQMFVIKLSILKSDKDLARNKVEGEKIDVIHNKVPPRVKALFQGKTDNIDFAIFNYLGQDLETFLRYNSRIITPTKILSLITQLHKQLYELNFNNSFHNDVKNDNICINNSGELTVIDFGSKTDKSSNIGSLHTICVVGIINYLMRKINSKIDQLQQSKQSLQILQLIQLIQQSQPQPQPQPQPQQLQQPQQPQQSQQSLTLEIQQLQQLQQLLKGIKDRCKSSDYVGFFNVIIDIICRKNILWPFLFSLIFNNVLSKDVMTNLLKLLYFFYYITIDKDLWNYEELKKYDMVKKIFDETSVNMNDCLSTYNIIDINRVFPFRIYNSKYNNLRRFLYHLYIHIKVEAIVIIKEETLALLLFNLGRTCLQPNFDLPFFNTNFNVFFSDSILKEPTVYKPPTYISSELLPDVSIIPQPYVSKEVGYEKGDYEKRDYKREAY
jgi:hypothetical protein